MANWQAFQLSQLLPSEVRDVADVTETITSTIATYLETLKAALEIVQSISDTAASNPVETAISGILDEIETLLDGLVNNTTAHVIFVPIQKQFLGRGVRLPITEVGGSTAFRRRIESINLSLEASSELSNE